MYNSYEGVPQERSMHIKDADSIALANISNKRAEEVWDIILQYTREMVATKKRDLRHDFALS